jgi:uncharacterized membrane protein
VPANTGTSRPGAGRSGVAPVTVTRTGYAGWAWPLTLAIATCGLGLAAYLTYVHFTDPASLSCPDTGVVNCLKVTTSSQSEIFGVIPVAVAGLAFFAGMVVLCTPWAWRAANPWVARLRLAGAVAGIGMVVYLVYVEAVQLHALCLYCTAVHGLTFLLLLAILAATLLRPIAVVDGD